MSFCGATRKIEIKSAKEQLENKRGFVNAEISSY